MIKINGKNGIYAKVLLNSSNGVNNLITLELQYPRIIHSELMTHRTLSKNCASSRAVPIGKAIEHVQENPMFPVYWGSAKSGMQAGDELSGNQLIAARQLWQRGIDQNIILAKEFDALKVHKQIASRWLETGQLIKTVITGTDWDNFLWLRNDNDAQPEFQELARCVQSCMDQSFPQMLYSGQWHLPFIETIRDSLTGELYYLDSDRIQLTLEEAKQISASCCAQVSYRRLNDSKEKAIEIFTKLFSGSKPHMSPCEHQGTPVSSNCNKFDPSTWQDGITHVRRDGTLCSGNFAGWVQYRQTLPNNVFVKS